MCIRDSDSLILTQNKLGYKFLTHAVEVLKFDSYLRMLDLRNNRITQKHVADKNLDLVKSLQRNESLTNLDLRENACFDRELMFKLSLIMLRNIDKLRSSGK